MTKFYGLTGGICSGKSTVAKLFKTFGIPTLDLDQVGKTIINNNPEVVSELTQAFGSHILNADKTIHRKELARLAFQNEKSTKALNHIMHPRIKAFETNWRSQQTAPLAIIEASVLIESGDIQRMDGLIVVLCDMALRQQRVLQRGHQSLKVFEQIVKRQCTDETRRVYANYIFENNSDLEHLKNTVHCFIHSISTNHL